MPIHQPGRTGILCVNEVAHQTLKPGDDVTGLGWWCWTRVQGPNGFFESYLNVPTMCLSGSYDNLSTTCLPSHQFQLI